MPRHPEDWTYNYQVLSRITGLPPNTIQQHKVRGKLNPRDLESVLLYMAEYARDKLRAKIVERAIHGGDRFRTSPTAPKKGGRKSK